VEPLLSPAFSFWLGKRQELQERKNKSSVNQKPC
jgi:hypothetical protein